MQQVYLKRMTKQDITKSVTISAESVDTFWGVDKNETNDYVPISICHEDNPKDSPEGITIHKGYQGEKDWRICGKEWKKLYAHEDPEEGDIMEIRKMRDSFSVKIVKKDSEDFKVLSSLFVGNDNYAIITTDKSDGTQYNEESFQQIITTDASLRAFVLKTINHFSDKDGLESLIPYAVTNPNDEDSKRIKIYKEGEFNLVGMFIKTTSEDLELRNKDAIRWYEDEFKLGDATVYLSTQWNGSGDHQLTFKDFVSMIKCCYGEQYSVSWSKENGYQLIIGGIKKQPLQQIFYGAPGTGKSHEIKNQTKGKSAIRTTFHPDSDYSTFVGAYKPFMDSVEARVVPVVINNGISLNQNVGTYNEKRITYKFVKQAFSKAYLGAWKKYAEKNEGEEAAPQYLIIEEINRGNCAQIFGDLFQLLDRSAKGFSEYPIEADTDMKDAIKNAFAEEDEYRVDSLNIDDVIDGYISNYDSTLSNDVREGRVLLLPPNLYIWATMNTSDQSLFPIDSAFKRRWDWVYRPISYKNSHWTIVIGEKRYYWVDFQKMINQKIYDVDNSEDKQLGDYFVNADRTGNTINADSLLNKILFYLWNDVCKDDPDQIFRWINDKKQVESIKFSDFFGADKEKKLQGFMAFNKINAIGEQQSADTNMAQQDEETETSDTPTEEDNDLN